MDSKRYNDNTSTAWKVNFEEFIAPYGGNLICYCNVNLSQVKKWNDIPIYYKDMLTSYFDFVKPDKVAFASQCVWNFFNQRFYDAGLKFISEVYNENGSLSHFSD